MSAQPPREFWASGSYSFTSEDALEKFLEGWSEGRPRDRIRKMFCHTIEKSAYDRLKDHAEKLAEALEFATMPIACETQSLEEVIKTVKFYDDKIREVLTEYRKEFENGQ